MKNNVGGKNVNEFNQIQMDYIEAKEKMDLLKELSLNIAEELNLSAPFPNEKEYRKALWDIRKDLGYHSVFIDLVRSEEALLAWAFEEVKIISNHDKIYEGLKDVYYNYYLYPSIKENLIDLALRLNCRGERKSDIVPNLGTRSGKGDFDMTTKNFLNKVMEDGYTHVNDGVTTWDLDNFLDRLADDETYYTIYFDGRVYRDYEDGYEETVHFTLQDDKNSKILRWKFLYYKEMPEWKKASKIKEEVR